MQDFIVLGLVPGTNIQVTLSSWLILSVAVLLMLSTPRLVLMIDTMRRYLIMREIARTISHFDLITI